jgi:hypothetical protein
LSVGGGLAAGVAVAAPSDEALVPVEKYTSEKGRALAQKYSQELRALSSGIYHCIPWVEIEKESIGFQRPRHLQNGDVRYLSLRIFVEQDPSPAFARMTMRERASAMYSRYVGPLLVRMAKSQPLTSDASVDGFTIILDWLKQWVGPASDRPVHETIAVFIEKAAAVDFLSGKAAARDLSERAQILGWDGDTPLGPLKVTHHADDFVATYKVKNYQLEAGVSCP